MSIKRKTWKRILITVLAVFVVLNVVAAFHAWKFTHFTAGGKKPDKPEEMGFAQKLKVALTGVDIPRPENTEVPNRPYQTITLQNDVKLSAWYMPATVQPAKGTVILFHGYGGDKSRMLDKAYIFEDAGYNVLVPDFRDAGASEGSTCTIGFKEARDVKTCVDYIRSKGEKNVFLFGTSMGAAAVLKYIHDGNTQPSGIIIECPFGTMYETVCARFRMLHFPEVPMASVLVFWGGLENGFWAFDHNPEAYAKAVHCPTLLMYGEKDDRVTRKEIDAIYGKLAGPKVLKTFPEAGHNNYLTQYRNEWTMAVTTFINQKVPEVQQVVK